MTGEPLLGIALMSSGALILACAAARRTRRRDPPLGYAGLLAAWRAAHLVPANALPGGRLTGTWLRTVHRLAGPLVRLGVSPDLVTAGGLWLAFAAAGAALAGPPWAALAGGLTLLSGLADGLDGAVAAMGRGATPFGAVLDATADRLADLVLVAGPAALVVHAGRAPAGAWALSTGAGCVLAAWLLELTRARAQQVAPRRVAALATPGERPTRIILLGLAGLLVGTSQLAGSAVARSAVDAGYPIAFALIGLAALVGTGQLLVAVASGQSG